jgi:hypothetical protein
MNTSFEDLTDQEQLFLEILFNEETNPFFDPEFAKQEAGYPASVSSQRLMRRLKSVMQEDVQSYLLGKAPLAAKVITNILKDENPSPSMDKLISAASQVLDRAGITKKDKQEIEIKAPEGIIILPPLNNT